MFVISDDDVYKQWVFKENLKTELLWNIDKFWVLEENSLHQIENSMLFLYHKSDSCRSGIVFKLWSSVDLI